MQDLFIGVDGGGTKTEAIVMNDAGIIIGSGKAGPGNIKTSAEASFKAVHAAIQAAFTQAGIVEVSNYRLHAGLGMAGTEVPGARSAFLSIPHPFTTLILNSDAYVACLGVHGGNDGAIIIIGTGVIGFQIENIIESRVGGYGFPHSDEGGGAHLGLELLRATFQAYDGRLAQRPLFQQVFKYFQNDFAAMTSFANRAKPADFGMLAPFVINALGDGDDFALQLLKNSAQEIDRVSTALTLKSQRPLNCGLLGGIAPFITPHLSCDLRARLIERKMSAPEGAILMLKKQMEQS